MCHEYHGGVWNSDYSDVDPESDEDETSTFLSDDEAEDVEILTDGGDES